MGSLALTKLISKCQKFWENFVVFNMINAFVVVVVVV